MIFQFFIPHPFEYSYYHKANKEESPRIVTRKIGVRRRKGLWSQRGRQQLESLTLANSATRRRKDLLTLLDRLNPRIEESDTTRKRVA